MTEPVQTAGSEQDLQRRWAESHWPAPFLHTGPDRFVRVISPGRWNHGPGPDFRGAQLLDSDGRARRGDVELHLEPRAWLQHGHDDDPAYARVLLHIVERSAGRIDASDPRIPDATRLPPISAAPQLTLTSEPADALPCSDIVQRAGVAAVEARLQRIALRRFQRKARELQAMPVPPGPGSETDRRAWLAAARALGQPHNAALALLAAGRALEGRERWDDVDMQFDAADRAGWRRGRGALGTPAGFILVLTTLLERWTVEPLSPSLVFGHLSSRGWRDAVGELHIANQLGRVRATQLLADAVYPLTLAWSRWLALPGARYQRTDELRARLDGVDGADGVDRPDDGFAIPGGWRHPHTQALLELEQTRCRHWACRICPLAAVGLSSRAGREDRRT
ncbi:MAG: DUF2851 family protein [Chloroflexi bacterium]|nr:DUF2851 family protein [Chloroflexota bacterium]